MIFAVTDLRRNIHFVTYDRNVLAQIFPGTLEQVHSANTAVINTVLQTTAELFRICAYEKCV